MGFYSSEVIIGDAQRHGVDLLPPAVRSSDWDYTIEKNAKGRQVLRTGLRTVKGLGLQGWEQLATARRNAPFCDLADFCRRSALSKEVVSNLIRAGALDGFGERRQLLWQLGELRLSEENALPLATPKIDVALPDEPRSSRWCGNTTCWACRRRGRSWRIIGHSSEQPASAARGKSSRRERANASVCRHGGCAPASGHSQGHPLFLAGR